MSKKLMIVDDAVFMRQILKNMVEEAGYNVVVSLENGKQALDKYKELQNTDQKIDGVLMDITMPEMDGITALKKIKEFDKDAVVVMCSSLTAKANVVQAIQLGADHFIKKPFNKADVVKVLEKVLNKS